MAKYEVIEQFQDQDGTVYEAKKAYPFPANKKITAARLKELSGKNNKYGRPFIKEIKDEKDKN